MQNRRHGSPQTVARLSLVSSALAAVALLTLCTACAKQSRPGSATSPAANKSQPAAQSDQPGNEPTGGEVTDTSNNKESGKVL